MKDKKLRNDGKINSGRREWGGDRMSGKIKKEYLINECKIINNLN